MKKTNRVEKVVVEERIEELWCDFCGVSSTDAKVHDLTLWRNDDITLTKNLDMCLSCFERVVLSQVKR